MKLGNNIGIHCLGIAAAVSAIFAACSNDSAPKADGLNLTSQQYNCGSTTLPSSTTTSYNTNSYTNTYTTTSVALTAETTYEQNIKPIIDSKCQSCHATGTTKLSNYDEISTQKYDITSVLAGTLASSNHVGLSLTDADKQAFNAWRDSGYPRGTASTSTGLFTSTATTYPSTNCPTSTTGTGSYSTYVGTSTSTTSTEFDLNILLNSERAKRCEAAGKVVNRDEKNGQPECFGATLDMSWCGSAASIAQKFGDLANAKTALQSEFTRLGVGSGGFEIDKCGVENNKPMVTLYKKIQAETKIEIRVIRAGN